MAFREALRTLLHANTERDWHSPPDSTLPAPDLAEAVDLLNTARRSAPLRVRFQSDGDAALEPDLAVVEGAIARLLAVLVVAMADGTWIRLDTPQGVPQRILWPRVLRYVKEALGDVVRDGGLWQSPQCERVPATAQATAGMMWMTW